MEQKVSVVMATYNGEKFLKQQLDSILMQLPPGGEVIISDDGSTDATLEIISRYDDSRIKVYKNELAKGAKNNFENALRHATGDFIFLSDQDDAWKPGKVEACCEALKQFDMAVSDCEIIDHNNKVIVPSYYERRKCGKGFIKNLWANTYTGCCMAFRRSVLEIALPFKKDIPMHDVWLGFITELFFQPVFLPQVLVSYRAHEGNVTPTTVGISPYGVWSKLMFRWNTIKYIPLLLFRKWKKSGQL